MAVPAAVKRRMASKNSLLLHKIMKQKVVPPEILVKIASKLPTSTILQCCPPSSNNKSELDKIILDPLFPVLVQCHNHSSQSNTTILAYDGVTNTTTLIEYDHKHHLSEFRIDMDFVDDKTRQILSNGNVVASSNGWLLICCQLLQGSMSCPNSVSTSLRLVNPITRRCVVLPEPTYLQAFQDVKYGFGHSSKTGQWKVIRLYHKYGSATITAEVLTICDEEVTNNSNCSWVVMNTDNFVAGIRSLRSDGVALNGALHWLVDQNNLILRFDLDKEKFEFMETPYSTKTSNKKPSEMTVSYLGVLDGLLYVGAYNLSIDKGVEIWVMSEYGVEESWTPFTVVDDLHINERFSLIPVLKDGKVLILSHKPGAKKSTLDVYDPKERKRDQRVPLLEGMNEYTRGRMTEKYFVPILPSFL